MTAKSTICAIAILAILHGCNGTADWPWRKKNVPVTPPQEDITAQEAVQSEPAEPVMPVESVERPEPTKPKLPPADQKQLDLELVDKVPAETQPTMAPATQPVASIGPISLESIAPASRKAIPVASTIPAESPLEAAIQGERVIVAASLLHVNDTFLTVDDVVNSTKKQLATLQPGMDKAQLARKIEQILRGEMQNQVTMHLVEAEAEKSFTERHFAYIDREMDKTLRRLIAQAGGSRTKLEADLAAEGLDLDKELAKKRRSMVTRMFMDTRFTPAIAVTQKMLWDYYRRNENEFSSDRKVQMQIITAPYRKFLSVETDQPTAEQLSTAKAGARATIDEAVGAIKSGEDFSAVAARLSKGIKARNGGLWPIMPQGSFREKEVEAAAFGMPEGQVSDVIETETGYYIVKVNKVQAGNRVTFEQAQEQIEAKLRQIQYSKLEQKYFQRLISNSRVDVSQEFLQLAVDRATIMYRKQK